MPARTLDLALGLVIAFSMAAVRAAVSSEEAKALGTTLTEFGAIKAANADGSIPAYQGGLMAIPAAQRPAYLAAMAAEKPLFSVNAGNMARYAALLSEGTKALMQKYPSFRLDVYSSQRTMSYPDWVLRNTVRSATTVRLVGNIPGDGIDGGIGGIPFPIPKNGYEALWNHALKYQGEEYDIRFTQYLTDSTGRSTMVGDLRQVLVNRYYEKGRSALEDNWFSKSLVTFYGPASSVGTKILIWSPLNYGHQDQRTWIYTPGLRRTRLAPEQSHDSPSPSISGALLYEEQQMYFGRLDRFEFELKGRREMLIPYNNWQWRSQAFAKVWGKDHALPDGQRWERHRVWVVEGRLRPGARHFFHRRVFYIDEDSWTIVASEAWDGGGQMFRVAFAHLAFQDDRPGVPPPAQTFYDLSKGSWVGVGWTGDSGGFARTFESRSRDNPHFTPDAMAASGLR
jgi:hypothetical protein